MKYFDHEYIVPIIIGSGKKATVTAKRIRKLTGAEVHLFSDGFTLWQRLLYRCHRVDPMKSDFLMMSLDSFAESIEEYFFPVIILCGEEAEKILEDKFESLESSFVIARYDEFTRRETAILCG